MHSQSQRYQFSRRSFLKGIGAGALSFGVSASLLNAVRRVHAQGGDYVPVPSGFVSFTVGEAQVSVIEDGTLALDGAFFGVNADPDDVYALLQEHNLPTSVRAGLNITVVQVGDRRILVDTGLGLNAVDPSQPPSAGRLIPTLGVIGLTPDDITDVVITHFHPDHIAGVSDGTAATYPNAIYHFPQGDWDFVQAGPTGDAGVDGLTGTVTALFAPIEASGQLNVFASDAETELLPGVVAVPTPGHSPGHIAVLLSSGDRQLLVTGDAITNAIISLARPDYYMGFDAVPDLAVDSRRALLDRVATDQIQTLGYHFPFPGVGYISAEGDGYRFDAAL